MIPNMIILKILDHLNELSGYFEKYKPLIFHEGSMNYWDTLKRVNTYTTNAHLIPNKVFQNPWPFNKHEVSNA